MNIKIENAIRGFNSESKEIGKNTRKLYSQIESDKKRISELNKLVIVPENIPLELVDDTISDVKKYREELEVLNLKYSARLKQIVPLLIADLTDATATNRKEYIKISDVRTKKQEEIKKLEAEIKIKQDEEKTISRQADSQQFQITNNQKKIKALELAIESETVKEKSVHRIELRPDKKDVSDEALTTPEIITPIKYDLPITKKSQLAESATV